MTNKKTDEKAGNESADEAVNTAPYLSAKTETADTTEGSSMVLPLVLTLALAAAIFVIFYGDEYRNLMASIGIDIEETAVSEIASAPGQTTRTEVTAAEEMANDDTPPADDSVDSGTVASKQTETSITVVTAANSPATSTTSTTQTAPASGHPGTSPNPQAYAAAQPYPYNYSAAPQYRPRPDYQNYDRPYRPSQSYDEMQDVRQKMLKELAQEQAEAYKAYHKRMKEMAQERAEAYRAYEERMKARKGQRSPSW